MNILDKLPTPPEGYEWRSSISANENTTNIYLRLEPAFLPGQAPKVPDSYRDTYEFCLPDEDSVVKAAARILGRFDEGVKKRDALNELRDAEAEKYAHLLTEGVDNG